MPSERNQNRMKKFKNILAQNIVLNLTYAVVTVLYFIFISMQYSKFNQIDLEETME